MNPHPLDPEELLGQAGRLRAIARRLTSDSHAAEDLVQETWVAALEADIARVPEWRTEEGWTAWLGGITRNLARRRARREAMRRGVESEAARPETGTDPGELEQRIENQERLGKALLALPEPFRSALALRYLDGVSYEEIAQLQGVSNANARKRVSRGLALLRQQLGGDSNAWLASILGWLGFVPGQEEVAVFSTAAGWKSILTGGALVSMKIWTGVAVVALGAFLLVTNDGENPHSSAAAELQDLTQVTEPSEADRRGEPDLAGTTLDAPGETQPGSARAEAAGVATVEWIQGTVHDSAGRGLEGVEIGWAVDYPAKMETIRSDAEGAFRIAQTHSNRPLVLRSETHLSEALPAPVKDELAVMLLRKPELRGTVVDPEGAPVAPPGFVDCIVRHAGSEREETFYTQLLSDGTYRFESLPLGTLTKVAAHARGFTRKELEIELSLEAEATQSRDLVLGRGLILEGVVRDDVSGEPVPFARVWSHEYRYSETSGHPATIADEKGRYRISGVEEDLNAGGEKVFYIVMLMGDSPEHAPSPFEPRYVRPNADGVCEMDLTLVRASTSLRARFFEPDGETPASRMEVWIFDQESNFDHVLTDENGEIDFGKLPAGEIGLRAMRRMRDASGAQPGLVANLTLENGQEEDLEFVLEANRFTSVSGRVVDLRGQTVADQEVVLTNEYEFNGISVPVDFNSARTDNLGRFRFEGVRAGAYRIRVGNCERPFPRMFELESGEERRDVELVLADCMTVSGWVDLGADSGDSDADYWIELHDPEQERFIASCYVGDDGSFELKSVLPGDYEVRLRLGNDKQLDSLSVDPESSEPLILRVP